MKGILTDNEGNLLIIGGGVVVDDNRAQIACHLTGAFTGEYKHAPTLGGNAKRLIAGTPDPFWKGKIKKQLRQALIEVNRITVQDGEIEIDIKD